VSGEKHVVPASDVASRALAYSDAEREVMDCHQLSFKLTANSMYGQLGSNTSEIRDKRLAACVTTVGRNLIQWVVSFAEAEGPGIADRHFASAGMPDVRCERARVVYGDTDSVFIVLRVLRRQPSAPTGPSDVVWAPVIGKEAIPLVMAGAEAIAAEFTARCARPNVLEPEKTYFPLLLKGKKMYCGNLYPHGNPTEYKFSTMGLSTKRRDNAPISKRAINALLDPIMTDFDVRRGLDALARIVSELVDGTVPLEDLIISKTLKGSYKNPDQIPHKTLAERMGRRDSGSKPPPNSRVPYIFVELAGGCQGIGGKRKLLQGDRIEHPDYIRANRIKPDLLYYLETQIAGYAVQLLGVIVERLPGYPHPEGYWEALERDMLAALRHTDCTLPQAERRARVKFDAQRQGLARDLVFGPVIAAMRLRRDRQSLITSFFSN
jgi:DNA polymerase elongation subunit (family B)